METSGYSINMLSCFLDQAFSFIPSNVYYFILIIGEKKLNNNTFIEISSTMIDAETRPCTSSQYWPNFKHCLSQ